MKSIVEKIKEFVIKNQNDIILAFAVILISLLSFAVGYLIAKNQAKEPLRFEETGSILLGGGIFDEFSGRNGQRCGHNG